MANKFRKILIKLGKVIPFILAAVVAFGHCESIYAIIVGNLVEYYDGATYYDTPVSDFIGSVIYIDYLDVLLLYILAIALELCKYNFRCVHYLTLNLAVRTLLERVSLDESTIIPICGVMAAIGLICACGGIKMMINK